jgi:hypothetical protein
MPIRPIIDVAQYPTFALLFERWHRDIGGRRGARAISSFDVPTDDWRADVSSRLST